VGCCIDFTKDIACGAVRGCGHAILHPFKQVAHTVCMARQCLCQEPALVRPRAKHCVEHFLHLAEGGDGRGSILKVGLMFFAGLGLITGNLASVLDPAVLEFMAGCCCLTGCSCAETLQSTMKHHPSPEEAVPAAPVPQTMGDDKNRVHPLSPDAASPPSTVRSDPSSSPGAGARGDYPPPTSLEDL
jgi:hypothetical protein